jgi:hypothetical protein
MAVLCTFRNSLVVDDDDGQSRTRPEWTKASMCIIIHACTTVSQAKCV